MDNEGEWTVVRSKKEIREERKLQQDIKEKIKESEIMGAYKIFYKSKENYKPRCLLNPEISKDLSFLKYVNTRFIICDDSSKSDRLININNTTRRELFKYFARKKLNIHNYRELDYPSDVETRRTINGKLMELLAIYKITLKSEDVFQIVLVFTTNEKDLPYFVSKYIENPDNSGGREKGYFFSNYYQLILFLFYLELSLGIRKPTLVKRYPANFDDLDKDDLTLYFSNFNKIWS